MDELVTVSVLVPKENIGALYELCGRWIELTNHREREQAKDKAAGLRPWSSDDPTVGVDARRLYWSISEGAKKIMDALTSLEPHHVLNPSEAAYYLGFGEDELAASRLNGTISSVSRKARELGRMVPYESFKNPDGSLISYAMEEEVQNIFYEAKQAGPID
jgi:hypothetical protein